MDERPFPWILVNAVFALLAAVLAVALFEGRYSAVPIILVVAGIACALVVGGSRRVSLPLRTRAERRILPQYGANPRQWVVVVGLFLIVFGLFAMQGSAFAPASMVQSARIGALFLLCTILWATWSDGR